MDNVNMDWVANEEAQRMFVEIHQRAKTLADNITIDVNERNPNIDVNFKTTKTHLYASRGH